MNWVPIKSLRSSDLLACPVWEIRAEGDLELVRAAPGVKTIEESDADALVSAFVCLSSFRLACGREEIGFCSPQDSSGMDYVQPTIIFGERHWNLWLEACPADLRAAEVFPVAMTCRVESNGRFLTASLKSAPLKEEPNQSLQPTAATGRG
jgi:hypothetical protein